MEGLASDYREYRRPEFQVVVVVDYDDRIFPLTENIPNCLLPVANRPILSYQLDMLHGSGVLGKFITNTITITITMTITF